MMQEMRWRRQQQILEAQRQKEQQETERRQQQNQIDRLYLELLQDPDIDPRALTEAMGDEMRPSLRVEKFGQVITPIVKRRAAERKKEEARKEREPQIQGPLVGQLAAQIQQGVPVGQRAGGVLAGLRGIGVPPEMMAERFRQVQTLGQAEADVAINLQKQAVIKARRVTAATAGFGTETERYTRALETGKLADGRPVSPWLADWMRMKLETQLAGSGEGMLISHTDGTTVATGAAIGKQQAFQLNQEYAQAQSFQRDIKTVQALIQEDPGRVGLKGTLRRTGQTLAQILTDFSPMQAQRIREGVWNTIQRAENEYAQDPKSVDPALLEYLYNLETDTGIAGIQVLGVPIIYEFARENRRAGRLTVEDVRRAERALGLTGKVGSQRVYDRLMWAFNRSKANSEDLEKRINRGGAVIRQRVSLPPQWGVREPTPAAQAPTGIDDRRVEDIVESILGPTEFGGPYGRP
jgi:hypothetical protein